MAHRLGCSVVCGIFLDQGSNPSLLHWQADSLPLSHLGSPCYSYQYLSHPWASRIAQLESACNSGDPGSISGSGRSAGEGIGYPLQYSWASPCGSAGKESACNVGDLGSIPGLGRSPGEGKGCPLQYSGLENSMDCIVLGVAKSQTQMSDFHFHFQALLGCFTLDIVSSRLLLTGACPA